MQLAQRVVELALNDSWLMLIHEAHDLDAKIRHVNANGIAPRPIRFLPVGPPNRK